MRLERWLEYLDPSGRDGHFTDISATGVGQGYRATGTDESSVPYGVPRLPPTTNTVHKRPGRYHPGPSQGPMLHPNQSSISFHLSLAAGWAHSARYLTQSLAPRRRLHP
ncbi:hypothetical protein BDP81DRAFT_61225 [Colletotrichum phormii]|uniref:Uncharacterized protein n=1 Tax=Colletotrichum phormii TaxID=359342 RepID=A0AAI9ZNA9_9PEZI|nr:uncharacterized protein BDP81DRAFT_61225 [Colletotrichum phormii]KAK1633797.1 hypothetical protein BDP81DRAFT_61225 [Colletotrichum phormii]